MEAINNLREVWYLVGLAYANQARSVGRQLRQTVDGRRSSLDQFEGNSNGLNIEAHAQGDRLFSYNSSACFKMNPSASYRIECHQSYYDLRPFEVFA
jgi:hypothetical protein